MAFVKFMGSTTGRAARAAAGLILIAIGAWLGGAWWVLAAAGLVPLAAGLANFCLLGPLFHAPLHATRRA